MLFPVAFCYNFHFPGLVQMLYDALRQLLTRAGAATENKRIFHPREAQIPPALPESLPALPEHLAWPGALRPCPQRPALPRPPADLLNLALGLGDGRCGVPSEKEALLLAGTGSLRSALAGPGWPR